MTSQHDNTRRPSEDTEPSPLSPSPRARLESLTGSQLKALLMVAADPDVQDAASAQADLERLLTEMSGSSQNAGAELIATAANQTTSVEELVRIKELAKTWAANAADSPHREAARLLYHIAVAAAFVHHAAAISGRPLRKQQFLYEKFAEAWTGHPIGRVFREAAAGVTG
jgi:hypothetical protein